jgi:hypothetical protein
MAWALGAACGGSSGDPVPFPETASAFPQGFLPARLEPTEDTGDVVFEKAGDLYAVDGSADVTSISKEDGSRQAFSSGVGGAASSLRSIVRAGDGRFFVADDAGMLYVIDSMGVSAPHVSANVEITGMAIAPGGFGDLGGSIIAATVDSRLLSITTDDPPAVSDFVPAGDLYVDVAFSGTTLYALDATNGEIDTVDTAGTPTSFEGSFVNPVGLAVNSKSSELFVADAGTGSGDGILYAVPIDGSTSPIALAIYDFDPTPPSGIAYDGAGAMAWVSRGSVVVHGAAVPRVDPASPNFGRTFSSPDTGYGDLEFLRDGRFILVANREGSSPTNFLFRLPRDVSVADAIASAVGQSDERLLSLAYDPVLEIIYMGSDLGNLYQRSSQGAVSLVAAVSGDALLGLELAPDTFGGFGGHLVASTEAGEVLTIDPAAPAPSLLTSIDSTNPPDPAILSDLVFASDGRLFVLDNGRTGVDGQVLEVESNGTIEALVVDPIVLGLPEGVEMDEGENRLLIASADDLGLDQLIEVKLGADGAGDESIGVIANLTLDDGFFPTGIVYDRLGTVIIRQLNEFTSIEAFPVAPTP